MITAAEAIKMTEYAEDRVLADLIASAANNRNYEVVTDIKLVPRQIDSLKEAGFEVKEQLTRQGADIKISWK